MASGHLKIGDLAQAQRDFYLVQTLATKDNVDAMLSAQPNPADFSYDALKKNFWARSKGQIPVGVN